MIFIDFAVIVCKKFEKPIKKYYFMQISFTQYLHQNIFYIRQYLLALFIIFFSYYQAGCFEVYVQNRRP